MAASAVKPPSPTPDVQLALAALAQARERTLALVAGLSAEALEAVHSPIMSPLVWDLAHIAAYEDLWLAHRHASLELLREDLAGLDNARPRHTRAHGAFAIARRPVSNASWMHFSEGGGYVRREWWSAEGWAWMEEHDITHHPDVAAGHPLAPVCHVSWFEADAFARAHGARLPTEVERERAATWRQD